MAKIRSPETPKTCSPKMALKEIPICSVRYNLPPFVIHQDVDDEHNELTCPLGADLLIRWDE